MARDSDTQIDHSLTQQRARASVVRLREWGQDSEHARDLPRDRPKGELVIGRSADCWLRVRDDTRFVSRRHAEIVGTPGAWSIRDLRSTNGLWRDDFRHDAIALVPGLEIGIGSARLIAESEQSIALYRMLARLLGWSAAQHADVDRALHAVREFATRRRPLVLCGDDDLPVLGRHLHDVALDGARPFVVCDPKHPAAESTRLRPANEPDLRSALAAAAGGTLCIWANPGRRPEEMEQIARTLNDPGARVRLLVCARRLDELVRIVEPPVIVPSLADRTDDISRLCEEYGAVALAAVGGAGMPDKRDVALMLARRPRRLAETANGMLRLVALRHFGGVTAAARYLDVSHPAVSAWRKHRRRS